MNRATSSWSSRSISASPASHRLLPFIVVNERTSHRISWPAVAAGISPLFIFAAVALGIPVALSSPFAFAAIYVVLALAVVGLLISAFEMYWHLFALRSVLFAALAALFVLLITWLWQRVAFNALIPNRFLEYGYFLTPAGKHARFLVLELPLSVAAAVLACLLALAMRYAYKAGARWSQSALIAWWLVLFVVLGLPYLNWSLQGDAAIFV